MNERKEDNRQQEIAKIPIYDIHVMSDEEWNALAYRNWLERRCCA